jgi:SOS-response transcriptional repressor LexA
MATKRPRSPFRPKAPPRPITPRQSAILDAVRALTRETGQAPSAADVGARLGISKQSALRQLRAIEVKGLVSDLPKLVSSGQWQVTGDE